MLSAFAARKAQAANAPPTSASAPPQPVSSSNVIQQQIPQSPISARPISKRKSSSQQQTLPSSKKHKKKREPEVRRVRYFENALERREPDLIVIDSEEEVEVEADESTTPTTTSRPPQTGQRAWSPSAPLNDSSEDEDEEDQSDTSRAPASTPLVPHIPFTTFHAVPDETLFCLGHEEKLLLGLSGDAPASLLVLTPGQTLTLLGVYALTVMRGAVSLYGVMLNASPAAQRVYAPRSSALPVLKAIATSARAGLNKLDVPPRARAACAEGRAVVVLQQLKTGVEGLGRIVQTFGGVFEPSRRMDEAEDVLQIPGVYAVCAIIAFIGTHTDCSPKVARQSKDLLPFVISPSWEAGLASVSDAPSGIFLIKGHKKAGKSTFCRTLVNQLLGRFSKVAYLECDLGQSEFTPGGLVALNIVEKLVFGPPFSHPSIPNYAHYIGQLTPRSSPSHYLSAIQSAIESYQLDVQTPATPGPDEGRISACIPLVVNTMGWSKGLGADLTLSIEAIVRPTHIFQFEPPETHAVPDDLPAAHIHLLQPIAPSGLSDTFTASDSRAISMLSYFHAVFPHGKTGGDGESEEMPEAEMRAESWNTAVPLSGRAPYEVDWAAAFDKIVLSGAGAEDVVPSEIDRVLNGALVGLVACEPGSLDVQMSANPVPSGNSIPYTQGDGPPSTSTSNCRGLAFIRAVSPNACHILTPLPPRYLANGRVLVKGEMELPVWGMLDFREQGENPKAPFLQWDKSEGLGAEKRRIRRNLMRKGQM
ncbi:unnamed protein product [Mycena citricolor]|uniref:Polynucleotide 5'-hydroxyl-kinase GRC3 n=1 Tax=Mycena citricolor TaxID=2018698 RepID=A0AAD2Q745_9AGAR|nr:unnamed protein product [Mycena citricolor]